MTAITTHALQAATLINSAKAPTARQEDKAQPTPLPIDSFERIAADHAKTGVDPRLLQSIESEKIARTENPVFPSSPLVDIQEFSVIAEKLSAEAALNLQPGNRSGFLKSQIEPVKGVVLALHGWSAGTWQFEHMATQLTDQGYHVYAPRLPGHGLVNSSGKAVSTGFPQNDESQIYRDYADATYAEAASVGLPISIVGLSGGGAIALDIAGRYPDIQSATLYDPFLSPANPAEALVNAAQFIDRFTFGFASYLLRLIPIVFGNAKSDRDAWGRDGHVDFDGGMIFGLSQYGQRAVADSGNSSVPLQIVSSEYESNVVSRTLLKEVYEANTATRGWYHFPTEAEVPHAMIHWREFENDQSRAELRSLTFDFIDQLNPATFNRPR
ncbi:MAG: alpha/beta fold hydrolase [Deltaproteobacteria bacterium]|jgi:alpha-beta hydrolase superfamily lysophospholipase|nr:alpha/beta fold hydrolase [Deltaproteobacteria bacterium]MBT6436232.1 alpha/beta fold hydrolase [Deltaproteobacteria bacterium]MBT6491302.1 alpha/beta fold hydrolase [Deltaproteobacteria bacterium]